MQTINPALQNKGADDDDDYIKPPSKPQQEKSANASNAHFTMELD